MINRSKWSDWSYNEKYREYFTALGQCCADGCGYIDSDDSGFGGGHGDVSGYGEWRIYASRKKAIFHSDNGLSPVRRQAISWTSAAILIIAVLGI